MPFPTTDDQWMQVRSFLDNQAAPLDAILAPNEFLDLFPGTYAYNVSYLLPADRFAFVVIHKAMTIDIHLPLALEVLHSFHPVFANSVFVVYSKHPLTGFSPAESDIRPLLEQFEAYDRSPPAPTATCAAVIATRNQPAQLDRLLNQVLSSSVPVVVVDNGSDPDQAAQNQAIADRQLVTLLRLPAYRQTPSAINVGVSYWLADRQVNWISYFRDDVDLHPDWWLNLQQVQDQRDRPLLTGYDAPEHLAQETLTLHDQPVKLKRATSGVHLHAHRDYWSGVLPIPTPYLRDIEQPILGQGTDEDWWITAWSPQSIVKRGGAVVCVPDLVKLAAPASLGATLATPLSGSVPIPQPSAERSLNGVRVLVDGYNLQLKQGTGIKTYGLSLIQSLTQMGAQVDVLLSRGGYRSNPVLDEVYFFDNQIDRQNLLILLKGLLKTASGPLYRARRRQSLGSYVIKRGQYSDDFLKYATSFNLPQCYDIANALYKKLNVNTTISVTEPIDLWHCTYPLPIQIRGAKKITTVHDMIPLRLPYATLDDKENFYFKVRDALKQSAVTITVSENSKQDLLTYFDVDPDRIVVTYQPIALPSLTVNREEISFFLKRYGLDFQRYLLFVGAIEPKKNVGRLLDAYATIDTDLPLVIVGKKGWLWEDELAKVPFLTGGDSHRTVKLLEYVSPDALRYLYRGAYCLVFPSLYEGFGLPPIEAMHYGCPVITSNASCLPEVCGNAALYVDPYDIRDIKQKIEALLGDRALRDQLSRAGSQVAKKFSPENYRNRLQEAYRLALG